MHDCTSGLVINVALLPHIEEEIFVCDQIIIPV